MAKRKANLSKGKQYIIAVLLKEYDIQSADDIKDVLKNYLVVQSKVCWRLRWTATLGMNLMKGQAIPMHIMGGNREQSEANMVRWIFKYLKIEDVLSSKDFSKASKRYLTNR